MVAWGFVGTWFYRRERRRASRETASARAAGKPEKALPDPSAYSDVTVYGFTLGWFFGRMGCFVAHDHPGRETNFWLGIRGMLDPNWLDELADRVAWVERARRFVPELSGVDPSDIPSDLWQRVAYHDMGLYEAVWAIAMHGVLRLLDRRRHPPGYLFGLTLAVYGPTRLVLDAFRHDAVDTRYLGLTPAQYLSVAMTVLGAWILVRVRRGTPSAGALRQAVQTDQAR